MLSNKNKIRASRFLSKILRHDPAAAGITLTNEGWAMIFHLIPGMNAHGVTLTLDELFDIVVTNDKQRFELSDNNLKIRASQGHSIDVDLQLEPIEPLISLFHGTNRATLDLIYNSTMITKQSRQYVHLSDDMFTARHVGRRHGGNTVVIQIDTKQMYNDGYEFFLSRNGVWLTDNVPTKYFISTI